MTERIMLLIIIVLFGATFIYIVYNTNFVR
jgi:hypothetical protein